MDFGVSPDDRIGGGTNRGKKSKGTRTPKGRKPKRGERIEPGFAGFGFAADEPKPRRKPATKSKRGRQPKERKRLTLGRVLSTLGYWAFTLLLWGGIAVAGIVVYFYLQMPAQSTWAVPERPANIRIVASDGQLISNRGKMGGEAVALKDLPSYVPAAFIAIEDKRFYQHFGIDPIGIARAAFSNLMHGHIAAGGSTLTQQLAKNLFLTRDQTLGRKVQEAILALWLERNYTKDEILELYLNRVDFGHQMVGIEAASQFYFGHSASNLSLGEAAMLAGSVKAPSNLNPKGDSSEVNARQHVVLQAMADEGYISDAEAKAAAIDPNDTVRTKVAGSESYVADWVESIVQAYVGDVKQDVVVYTTINWDLQKEAEFLVKEAVTTEGPKYHFSQGALVAVDSDGSVRAVVGGADYQQSQYNRAVTARRQPGSTFKPFVYMAAMEKGYTPDTVADDDPININGWSPNDADNKFMGKMTLREALAYSRNTVAAQLAWNVGPDKVVEVAQRMGISSPLLAVPSIALGTQEVSLLELTAAYAPFANGGNGVIANVVTRIETADGKVLYDAVPAGPGQVVSPQVVGEMNDMLSTALDIGTGKHAKLAGWQIGGKTGTSQKARDALFVGFTSRMVCGVWLGNDDDTGTTLAGGTVPTQIWSDFMAKAHEGMTPQNLPDATSAAVPADQQGGTDLISQLATDNGGTSADSTAPDQPSQPSQAVPPPKAKNLGDLIKSLFGGG